MLLSASSNSTLRPPYPYLSRVLKATLASLSLPAFAVVYSILSRFLAIVVHHIADSTTASSLVGLQTYVAFACLVSDLGMARTLLAAMSMLPVVHLYFCLYLELAKILLSASKHSSMAGDF
jgi:hypothetical protein